MTVHVDIEPDLLKWAVERARWDDRTIEERAPHFAQWVAGTKQPTLKQLEDFATATHTPFGLLFLSERPAEVVPIPDMRTLGSQTPLSPSADLLDTIYMCQTRQDWYREYALRNGIEGPSFVASASLSANPEDVGAAIRRKLDFEVDDRTDFGSLENTRRELIDRLEELGVLVMVNGVVGSNTHRKLDVDEFRGFALSDKIAPLIFVNGADTHAAQIFTLFHELGHILLGNSALSEASVTKENGKKEELWCNSVAAEVLVPRVALMSDVSGQINQKELQRLSRKYCASTLVILKRLQDIGSLTWDNFRELYEDELDRVLRAVREQRERKSGGNFYNSHPLKVSREFARAVFASTFEGTTSYREAYQLLDTKRHGTFQNLAARLEAA